MINDAYINALLADASYVDGLAEGLTGDPLRDALQERLTQPQAAFVGENFSVVTQVGGFASGFDATVWRGRANTPYAGQVYVSMRGAQGARDIVEDGVSCPPFFAFQGSMANIET
jgi:hypothetical protein